MVICQEKCQENTFHEAKQNAKKNQTTKIVPFDSNRVELKEPSGYQKAKDLIYEYENYNLLSKKYQQ